MTDVLTPNTAPSPSQPEVAPIEKARLWALVPCAGNGSRSGAAGPKQYEPVAGQPMVLHTLSALMAVGRLAGVWVVVSQGDVFFESQTITTSGVAHVVGPRVVACGGETRAQSVANGLDALLRGGAHAEDWVLVHDAARCLVTPEQIDRLIDACQDDAVGGLLALRLPDTLKHAAHGRVDGTLDRSDKWLAQTPQMFRIGPLLEALRTVGAAVTDESSAMEAMGRQPLLVEGSAQNFKVTYPQDFALAQAVIQSRGLVVSSAH